MKLNGSFDGGQDLHPGDVVWIRAVVDDFATHHGDIKIVLNTRPGYDEYGALRMNAIFMRRHPLNWLRRTLGLNKRISI